MSQALGSIPSIAIYIISSRDVSGIIILYMGLTAMGRGLPITDADWRLRLVKQV
jgi:hypothetical protein